MRDPRKSETLDQRVRFRVSKLIDPNLYQVLSNHTGSKGCNVMNDLPLCEGAKQASPRD